MREFELIIDEALKNGLSPFRTTPFNTQVLKECFGFRCEKLGLERYEEGINPLPSFPDIPYSWPFPQFLRGERYNFLVVRDSTINHEDIIYLVSDDMQTITYGFSIPELIYGKGTLMELADFGLYSILTNGVIMVYWDPTINDWNEVTSSPTIPMMRTICNFKGQLFGGNIISSWYDCDEKFYAWSKIGDADFTVDKYNLSGYRRDPFGGEVYHVRRLADRIVGYSSKGITIISPVGSPTATFGFTELSNIGLINKGAMNGDLNKQIYVGSDYILREITEKGIKDIGYEPYVKGLEEDIIVSYDKHLGDFYISNNSKTYLLSPYGLTEIPQHPSTVWSSWSDTYMLPDTIDDFEPLILTQPFDMGLGGQKTIFEMESDITLAENGKVAVDYYLNPSSYKNSSYKPLNSQNVASLIVGGNAFAFRLKADLLNVGARISYLKARYKMTDLRGIRGVYAPPPRGQ